MDKTTTVQMKRIRVHYGHYKGWRNHYPVIRIGGKYLAKLNFDIGDTVEVTLEKDRITIAKVLAPVHQIKPDAS